jgi:hypothetical protein
MPQNKDQFGDKDLPENYAVEQIMALLRSLDGLNLCTSLGILEIVRARIYEQMHRMNVPHTKDDLP